MKSYIHALTLAALAFTTYSCGSSDSDKTTATVVAGTLKTSLLASTDVSSYTLTSATCTNDVNTGLLTASFSASGGAQLDLKIKGFSTTGQTYTCTQPEDNRDGDVGGKYNSCAVAFSIPDTSTGVNSYEMYRETADKKAITYSGSCSITTQYTSPKLTLTVNCGSLIQTSYQSAARNPIDATITGTVNSATSVECNI